MPDIHPATSPFDPGYDLATLESVRYFRAYQLSVGEWIRSFRGVEECAHFALDDLQPFWLMCWGLIKRPFHGGFHRL